MAVAEYALVVGVEEYASSRALPLQGPSFDAIRFALWLRRERGTPPSNILLLHNKCAKWKGELEEEYRRLSGELAGEGVNSRGEPTFEEVNAAWQKQLRSMCPDKVTARLWIYWSGHGVIVSGDGQALLCSDTNYFDDPQVLYLSELQDGLRTQGFRQFAQQWILLDACASYVSPYDLFSSGHRPRSNSI
jgi:hypothetical protein